MQGHEYFEELGALARIGQLSPEEHAELIDHLKACDNCRRAGDDFAVILDRLPLVESEVATDSLDRLQTDSYRSRFLRRAQSVGVGFSPEALNPKQSRTPHLLRLTYIFAPAAAAALVAVVILVNPAVLSGVNGLFSRHEAVQTPPAPVTHLAPAPSLQVASAPDAAVLALEAKYDSAERELRSVKDELAQAVKAKDASTSQKEQATQLVAQLQARVQDDEQSLAKTGAELDRLRSERDQTSASLVADAIRIQELNEQLRSRDTAVDQEKQLTAAAQDVRAMMGARNLHIIDVFDADGRGRDRKSFGRVFYVEGRSLIFYAFDLPQKGAGNTKVSFQAWGQRESSKDVAKNLGVFYIDDHAQKRWVLKVDDPEKLRAIDSLFVTVERFGGADRPTGQKLLYAYLGSQANHP